MDLMLAKKRPFLCDPRGWIEPSRGLGFGPLPGVAAILASLRSVAFKLTERLAVINGERYVIVSSPSL